MSSVSYTTLMFHNIETDEQEFARFIVEVRVKGETNLIALLSGSGRRKKNDIWEMVPIPWAGAIIGTTYESRILVEDTNGNRSPVNTEGWVSETAGDTTAPNDPATFTLIGSYATAKCSFSYTKPTDFDRFEWHVDTDNSAPTGDDFTHLSDKPELTVPASSGDVNVYFWVRAKDQSGNLSSWVSCGNVEVKIIGDGKNLIRNSQFEFSELEPWLGSFDPFVNVIVNYGSTGNALELKWAGVFGDIDATGFVFTAKPIAPDWTVDSLNNMWANVRLFTNESPLGAGTDIDDTTLTTLVFENPAAGAPHSDCLVYTTQYAEQDIELHAPLLNATKTIVSVQAKYWRETASSPTETPRIQITFRFRDTNDVALGSLISAFFDVTQSYAIYEKEITIPANTYVIELRILCQDQTDYGTSGDVLNNWDAIINKVKLEFGNVRTEFSDHSEDVVEAQDYARSAAAFSQFFKLFESGTKLKVVKDVYKNDGSTIEIVSGTGQQIVTKRNRYEAAAPE